MTELVRLKVVEEGVTLFPPGDGCKEPVTDRDTKVRCCFELVKETQFRFVMFHHVSKGELHQLAGVCRFDETVIQTGGCLRAQGVHTECV